MEETGDDRLACVQERHFKVRQLLVATVVSDLAAVTSSLLTNSTQTPSSCLESMPIRVWTRTIPLVALRMPPKPIRKHLKYLLILDFEATCGGTIQNGEREIIEFPTLLYNLHSNEVQAQFHEYVKPVRHPGLTDFCTDLTGIQQVCRSQRSWHERALTAVFRKQSILLMNFL